MNATNVAGTLTPDRGDGKPGSRKRILRALACPPALAIVAACHAALATWYWFGFARTGLNLAPAASYSVLTLVLCWKLYETYRKGAGPHAEID